MAGHAAAAAPATSVPLAFDMSRGGGVFGPTIAIDPGFEFYKQRPLAQTCRAIHDAGFTCGKVIWTGISATTCTEMRRFSDALRAAGAAPVLCIFPSTDLELYQTHPEWRQRTLDGEDGKQDWRTYCCPNKPAFVEAYGTRITDLMREGHFDGIQLAEIWWEMWGGPEDSPGKPRAKYACVCDACVTKFKALAGVDAREMLTKPESPLYWRKPENSAVYAKWVDFRVQTIQDYGRALIAAARRGNPRATIDVMYLCDARVKLDGSREFHGTDIERMVGEWKPDLLTLQDAWQDWTQPGLKPEFVADYAAAYRDRLQRARPGVYIMSHADIGSLPASKRSAGWIRDFAAATVRSGLGAPSFYEWSVSTLAK